jgi:hypothetical protein
LAKLDPFAGWVLQHDLEQGVTAGPDVDTRISQCIQCLIDVFDDQPEVVAVVPVANGPLDK